jgi:hypothetical protein
MRFGRNPASSDIGKLHLGGRLLRQGTSLAAEVANTAVTKPAKTAINIATMVGSSNVFKNTPIASVAGEIFSASSDDKKLFLAREGDLNVE